MREGSDSKSADDKDVQASAQKAIESLKNNPNIPEKQKAEMIAHEEGLMKGGNKGAATGPPSGG